MRRAVRFVASSLFVLLASGPVRARGDEMQVITIDRDDVEITRSTLVRPGTYRVVDENGNGVIHVRGSGLTLDLAGVVLDGAKPGADASKFEGIGVSVAGGADVRVHGGACRGFRVGLRAEGTRDLKLDHFDGSGNRRDRLRSTPEAEDASDWLWPQENDDGQWESRYGAAISLVGCREARAWSVARAHRRPERAAARRLRRSAVVRQRLLLQLRLGHRPLAHVGRDDLRGTTATSACAATPTASTRAARTRPGFLVFEQCSGTSSPGTRRPTRATGSSSTRGTRR